MDLAQELAHVRKPPSPAFVRPFPTQAPALSPYSAAPQEPLDWF
jgi:hypothetical protein